MFSVHLHNMGIFNIDKIEIHHAGNAVQITFEGTTITLYGPYKDNDYKEPPKIKLTEAAKTLVIEEQEEPVT